MERTSGIWSPLILEKGREWEGKIGGREQVREGVCKRKGRVEGREVVRGVGGENRREGASERGCVYEEGKGRG